MSAWVGRISRQGRGRDCSASSSNPMMEGPPDADSEEKHEPVSDIDTVVVVALTIYARKRRWSSEALDLIGLNRKTAIEMATDKRPSAWRGRSDPPTRFPWATRKHSAL